MKWRLAIVLSLFAFDVHTNALGKAQWLSVQSQHFNLVSDAGEVRTRELVVLLEQFRFVMIDIYKVQPPPAVVTMIVFSTDAAFKPFKPLYNGKPALKAATTASGGIEPLVALAAEHGAEALEIILHEYTHVLTMTGAEFWPAWLSEGEAEAMSTFRWNNGQAILGEIKPRHVQLLRAKKWLTLDQLFEVTTQSPDYNERNRQGIFYAESWALAHYLRFGDGGKHRDGLEKFLRLLREGRPAKDAFRQVFGSDLGKLQKALYGYIRDGTYLTYTPQYSHPDVDRDITVKPMDDAELQALFGTWLVDIGRPETAEPYFRKASAAAPNSARVQQWLGYQAFKQKDFALAAEHLRQAITPATQNHLLYFHYAAALFQARIGSSFELGKADPEVCRLVGEAAVHAIQLMPRFAPAYGILAAAHLAANDDLAEGVKMAERAIQLEPQNYNHRLTLAQLQLLQTHYSAARTTLIPLLNASADPAARTMAQAVLKQIERRENNR